MKNLSAAILLLFVLSIAACKKDDDNNNNNNNNNNQPDTRTGLERLTNVNSTNYCVIIVGTDTSIWQTTANDTVEMGGVIREEFPASYYFSVTNNYHNTHPHARLKTFQLELDRYTDWSHWHNNTANCSTPDSILKTGTLPEDTTMAGTKYRWYISMTDSMDTWAVTRLSYSNYIKVKSVTPITTSTGCKKLRVKGTFDALNLYNTICGPVPVFQIKQGAFQMDFKWNP